MSPQQTAYPENWVTFSTQSAALSYVKEHRPAQKERIEVEVKHYGGEFHHTDGQRTFHYLISLKNNTIHFDKFPAIKQAIESCLNDERECAFDEKKLQERYEELLKNPPLYTQQELDKAREDWYNIGKGVAYQNSPSYQTYISSLKKD